jgi:hypothetical protein
VNWGLLRSYHALLCLGLVVLLLAMFGQAGWPIEVNGVFPSRNLRLGTGVISLLLLVGVGAYVLRKYAHRGGYSPEFKMRTAYAKIEAGNHAIVALQARVDRGDLTGLKDVRKEAQRALKKAGASKVNRAIVEQDAAGHIRLRIAPTQPLGRMARWLQVHVWYGWLFGPVVLLHAGLNWPSVLGQLMIVLVAMVWLSGLVGIFMWARGPAMLTRQEQDLSIEEAHSLNSTLSQKIGLLLSAMDPGVASKVRSAQKSMSFLEDSAWGALGSLQLPDPLTMDDLRCLLGQKANVRKELGRLSRVRWMIMGWKLFHVPAALALAVMTAVHIYTIWTY